MRQHFKFFTVVISMLLLSSIILSGSMYAITNKKGSDKPYDLSGQMPTNNTNDNVNADGPKEEVGGNVPVDDYIPPILGNKFDVYDHQSGSSLTIFSEEQYNELKALRDGGGRDGLTYDEIISLVSDSIAKYFSYNEICLYNANVDHILPLTLTFSAIQSSSSCIIRPYHGDFLEFGDYGQAVNQYKRILEEIYAIIYYRIYMLDPGFIGIETPGSSGYQALVLDNSTVVDDKYKSSLRATLENIHLSGTENDSGKKILYTQTDSAFEADSAFDLSFVIARSDKDHKDLQSIYPTSELSELMPQQRIYCVANEGTKPFFMLDYVTGEAFLTLAEVMSSCRYGRFTVQDGVLTINLDAKDQILVFHKVAGGFAYSAELSRGGEYISSHWQDGLVFTALPHANIENGGSGTETITPSKPDDEISTYIKYDSNSDYCTLIGAVDIDGSYSSEDGRMIFLFVTSDGLYQYCFEQIDSDIYSYQKGISSPVPGCEFADETRFCKITYENCSSVILEPQ